MRSLLFLASALGGCVTGAVQTDVLKLAGAVTLPGVALLPNHAAKMDHLAADLDRGLLFIAVKENDTVAVVDLRTRAFVTSLQGVEQPQGLAVGGGLLIAASSGDGSVRAYDCAPPHALRWTATGLDDADNVMIDGDGVWVAHGGDDSPGALTLLALADGAARGSVAYPAGAHPEAFALEARGELAFGSAPTALNGSDVSLIVVVNRSALAVAAAWPLATHGLNQPFANLLDAGTGHLFVAAQSNDVGAPAFAVLDTRRAGAVVWSTPTNAVCDDIDFAPRLGLIFIACGGRAGAGAAAAGSSLTVVRQRHSGGGAVAYELLGDVASMPPALQLARTCFWDDAREILFVAVPAGVDFLNRTQEARLLAFALST